MTDTRFDKYRIKRNEALINLDIAWAKLQAPHLDERILLVGLHKARYDCTAIENKLRHESGEWLRENG
jgi:hypothetical protein